MVRQKCMCGVCVEKEEKSKIEVGKIHVLKEEIKNRELGRDRKK